MLLPNTVPTNYGYVLDADFTNPLITNNPTKGFMGLWENNNYSANPEMFQALVRQKAMTQQQADFFMNNPDKFNEAVKNGQFSQFTDQNGATGWQYNPNASSNDWLSKGTDQYGNTTWGGGTAMDWGKLGLGTAMGIWGAYQQHKGLKLAQQNFEEQKALNHANFKMQAKSYNNSLRNQQSGRGYVGMSGSAKRQLGREYDARRAEETY